MGDLAGPVDPSANPAILLSRLHRWRMAFFGLVILMAGAVIGAGSVMIWATHRTPARLGPGMLGPGDERPPLLLGERLVQRLRRSLRLSDQQMKVIVPIAREHMENLRRIRQETRPKVAEELRLMDTQIAAVLNKDQQQLWDRQFRRLLEQVHMLPGPYQGLPQAPRGRDPAQARPGEPPPPSAPGQ